MVQLAPSFVLVAVLASAVDAPLADGDAGEGELEAFDGGVQIGDEPWRRLDLEPETLRAEVEVADEANEAEDEAAADDEDAESAEDDEVDAEEADAEDADDAEHGNDPGNADDGDDAE